MGKTDNYRLGQGEGGQEVAVFSGLVIIENTFQGLAEKREELDLLRGIPVGARID